MLQRNIVRWQPLFSGSGPGPPTWKVPLKSHCREPAGTNALAVRAVTGVFRVPHGLSFAVKFTKFTVSRIYARAWRGRGRFGSFIFMG
jgi:hypothetical protein